MWLGWVSELMELIIEEGSMKTKEGVGQVFKYNVAACRGETMEIAIGKE